MKKITFLEAKYLKHAGKVNDVKVSLRIVDESPVIYIQDYEFFSFRGALAFLQFDSTSIVHKSLEVV